MTAARGFDALVGNPPFAGKNTLLAAEGEHYVEWLQTAHTESHGNSDVVAHFFRRAFHLLRSGGTFGLLATNTIAQGDTRSTGLRWICTHGGVVYDATRRYRWPGVAAVVVSIVHVRREPGRQTPARLDGRLVGRISAFLFHQGGDDDPVPLAANARRSFVGSYVLGMGFTFDDTNPNASPLSEMRRLITHDPRNQERIFPYLGGDELNSSPMHAHHRYVINFAQMSEDEARTWPDLISIVEAKVKPERLRLANNADGRRRKQFWWQWGRYTPALYVAIGKLERILVCGQTSKYRTFTFVPNGMVYDQKLIVFAADDVVTFCTLHSRCHELWALFFGSSMKDDPVYTPSDCFETFPFPDTMQSSDAIGAAGLAYYEFRAALMATNAEGLTDTYNRFHDPDERSPGILELRHLHDAMDRAVLDAYGWSDVRRGCAFLLDYEDDDSDDDRAGRARKKRKPWRYRWPDEVHDEVLARLLTLNADRASAEKRLGEQAKLRVPALPEGPRPKARRSRVIKGDAGPKLPGVE